MKALTRVFLLVATAVLIGGFMLAQAPPAPPASLITGVGNFSHIVANLDKSLAFYRDALGMEPDGAIRPFQGDPSIMKLGNTVGAQSRYIPLKAPGTGLGVELIEYKDIDRKPAQPRFYDPGAANLIARVRDFDGTLTRIKAAGGHVISAAGAPVTIGNGLKVVFVQDPDGFVVELNGAAANATGAGNVVSTGFEVAVDSTEKTVAFYRDLLGFNLNATVAFNPDKVMNETAGAPGASFRQSRAPIPGTMLSMTFIEFKDIERRPLRTRVQDPGTAILQLNVKDLDALLKTLKAAGYSAISPDGQAVTIGAASRLAIVRDPNNLYLELIQRGQ
ncbi:MAG TPA: VOC family protein [Terriglobia bacterium]|nr:VOC family protein [Terriglobia bacterium]